MKYRYLTSQKYKQNYSLGHQFLTFMMVAMRNFPLRVFYMSQIHPHIRNISFNLIKFGAYDTRAIIRMHNKLSFSFS